MRTVRVVTLAFLVSTSCGGCGAYDWPYYREARNLEASLAQLPLVEAVEVGGNEDLWLEDLWAKIRLKGGGELWLFQVSADSLIRNTPVYVGRIGDLFPKYSQAAAWGITADVGSGGLFADQLRAPIVNAADAIQRYGEIADTLARWPRCPEFAVHQSTEGPVRYCTQVGKSDGWWP